MSAWGDSWAFAWGDSWGATQVVLPGRFPRNSSSATYRPAVQVFARQADSATNRITVQASIRNEPAPNIRVTIDPIERISDKITQRNAPEPTNRTN